jgi:hypothetical protein
MKFVFSIRKTSFCCTSRGPGATNETVTAGVQTLPWHDPAVCTCATGGHYPALINFSWSFLLALYDVVTRPPSILPLIDAGSAADDGYTAPTMDACLAPHYWSILFSFIAMIT